MPPCHRRSNDTNLALVRAGAKYAVHLAIWQRNSSDGPCSKGGGMEAFYEIGVALLVNRTADALLRQRRLPCMCRATAWAKSDETTHQASERDAANVTIERALCVERGHA